MAPFAAGGETREAGGVSWGGETREAGGVSWGGGRRDAGGASCAGVAGPGSFADGASDLASSCCASSVSSNVPWDTLSPTLILRSLTTPALGDGTSIVALSDSSVTSASSGLIESPGFTSTSMTGISWKSPMSGTLISTRLLIFVAGDG